MPLQIPLYDDIKALADIASVKLDAILQRLDAVVHAQSQFELVLTRLSAQQATLASIVGNLEILMTALTDLQTSVAAQNTVIDSAIVLLNGLKDALDAAIGDPVALAALSAEIGAKTAALADAVVENTPPAPPPPEPIP